MRKASDFLSKPLISLDKGRNEGIIKNISFDIKLKNAEWLVLYDENDLDCDEKAVKLSEIYALGENAVMIRNGQAVIPAVSAPLNDNNPINCRIFTSAGKLTGIVTDVMLTDKNAVEELLYDKKNSLPLADIISSSRDIVVTADGDLKVKAMKAPAPKKVPVPRPADTERKVEALIADTAPKDGSAAPQKNQNDDGDIFAVAEKIEQLVKDDKEKKAAKSAKKVAVSAKGKEKEVVAVKADNPPEPPPPEPAQIKAELEAAQAKQRFEAEMQKELDRMEKNPEPAVKIEIKAAEEKQPENKPIERKLSEDKPAASKPAESKPEKEKPAAKETVKEPAKQPEKKAAAETAKPAIKEPVKEPVKEIRETAENQTVMTTQERGNITVTIRSVPDEADNKSAETVWTTSPARVKKQPETAPKPDPYEIYDRISAKPVETGPQTAEVFIYDEPKETKPADAAKPEKPGVAVPLKKNATADVKISSIMEAAAKPEPKPSSIVEASQKPDPKPVSAFVTATAAVKAASPADDNSYIVVDSGSGIQIWPYELEHIPERIIASYSFLLGRRVLKDIYNGSRGIIIKADSVVTAQTVETARKYGRLVDLTKLSR